MERRQFLTVGAAAAAGMATLAAPAVAQGKIEWNLATAFPKNAPGVGTNVTNFAEKVGAMSDGRLTMTVYGGGELVPPFAVEDAIQQGNIPVGHGPTYYAAGKNAALHWFTAVPFGMTSNEHFAWLKYGGGQEIWDDIYAQRGLRPFYSGNSNTQSGGWFKNRINSVEDLKGLNMRIAGLGGEIMRKLGTNAVLMPPPEIFTAFQSGAIDAAEWVGPYDDEKLGFYKVAKFYYYPGWWEPGPVLSFYVNKEQWDKLPKPYQAAFEAAAAEANVGMLAAYDTKNPQAIQRLVQNGTQLRRYPDDVMKAAYETAQKIYAEESAKNPDFKKLYDSMRAFQRASDIWAGLPEGTLANFMQAMLRSGK